MGYWDDKCFMCLFWSTLALIVGLSAKPIYKDIKKAKNEKVITHNISVNSIDSTRTNN